MVTAFLVTTLLTSGTFFSSQTAFAQVSEQRTFSIPAGPLNKALAEFGRQSGLQVTYNPAIAASKRTGGVSGSHAPQAALAQILQGSELTYSFPNVTTAAISQLSAAGTTGSVPDGATMLERITVQGENAWGHVDGIVAKRSGTGTKTDTPIEKIPQTINVVTADEVTARGAVSVTEALRYTPGINVNGFTDANQIADEITSRSFAPAPLYLDGAYLPYAGSLGGALQIDPYWLERIEVLKGPASVLYGQNQPGGIVNLVTKKPLSTPYHEVKVGYGSDNQKEVGVDFSGPVNSDQTLLYRFTGLVTGGDDQIDFTKSNRAFAAPSLSFEPTEQTSVTLYGQYQRDGGVPDYQPLPYIGTVVPGPDGKFISRDLFTGEREWNDFARDQYVLGADLDHSFSDTVKFRSRVRYVDVQDDYKGYYINRFVSNPDGTTDYSKVGRTKLNWAQHNSVFSVDNNIEVKYDTGVLQHTTLVGIDYRRFTRKYDGYNDYAATPIDLYNPDYSSTSPRPPLTTRWDNTLDQLGVYAQDQIEWDRFILTAGGRYDWARINNRTLSVTAGGTTMTDQQDDGAFTGRLGLTYVFDNGVAPYASYSESFLPQVGTKYDGESYKPTTGQQFEVGVKYQPQDMNALFTLSAYQVTQRNGLTDDHDHIGYYLQNGVNRTGFAGDPNS
ncbi:TonB-dependent siderophore receptor [Agrobacterium tumefaciens]|uniref:TonB-dependent siderophore receptor n=1 Tax=Agrobacterium tumefaciens TaxID=358 RepID=UPI001572E946|nr:TonB-dependent siderophore receptor [Agrobacterium tumefaciens]WCK05674.1 TonB-dependent siderophore receptor [Agrobacterium tumefaciens]